MWGQLLRHWNFREPAFYSLRTSVPAWGPQDAWVSLSNSQRLSRGVNLQPRLQLGLGSKRRGSRSDLRFSLTETLRRPCSRTTGRLPVGRAKSSRTTWSTSVTSRPKNNAEEWIIANHLIESSHQSQTVWETSELSSGPRCTVDQGLVCSHVLTLENTVWI